MPRPGPEQPALGRSVRRTAVRVARATVRIRRPPAFLARPLALAPVLVLGALLSGMPASPLEAQKPTIQSTRGGGGSSGRSGASLRPSGRPSSGATASRPSRGSIGSTRGPREAVASAPTLSPGFPARGRTESRAQPAQALRPAGGSVRAPAAASDQGKGYIRDTDRRRSDRDDRRFEDDWRWRRSHGRDRVRVILYQPWFYDPWLRYHRFDRFRYSFGLGCGFYDRWLPGFYGRRGFDPCFSSFGLFLGWPGFHDPWPGFWTWGFYGSEYANGFSRGFDEGFERGYGSGSYAPGAYAPPPSYDAAPAPGYGADLAPAPSGDRPPPIAGSDTYFRGRELMQAGDYAGALTAFDRHVETAPGDALAHLARGLDLVALGHYGKAADALRRGLDARDPWQAAQVDAPAHFASRAEFRRVLGDLEAYVRFHADNADARFALGVVYLFSGEREAARSVLRSLPGDPHARYLLGTLSD